MKSKQKSKPSKTASEWREDCIPIGTQVQFDVNLVKQLQRGTTVVAELTGWSRSGNGIAVLHFRDVLIPDDGVDWGAPRVNREKRRTPHE